MVSVEVWMRCPASRLLELNVLLGSLGVALQGLGTMVSSSVLVLGLGGGCCVVRMFYCCF